MKTIKTLVLVTLVTFSSQVFASSTLPGDDLKSVSQQVETFLQNAEIHVNDEITVNVKFTLDENNKIVVLSNDSNNYEISKFINSRLNLKELSINTETSHAFYYVPVKFLPTKE